MNVIIVTKEFGQYMIIKYTMGARRRHILIQELQFTLLLVALVVRKTMMLLAQQQISQHLETMIMAIQGCKCLIQVICI